MARLRETMVWAMAALPSSVRMSRMKERSIFSWFRGNLFK
jgi:hypothetical protein